MLLIPETIQDRINRSLADLSAQLQVAARYVVDNPVDVATRSLRSVAASSGVSPATFSRLARALGYDSYEDLREAGRQSMERQLSPFATRANALRVKAQDQSPDQMLQNQAVACIGNIEALSHDIDPARLGQATRALHDAGAVLLVGSKGSAGLIDYFGYMGQWFHANWKIAGRNGTQLANGLSRIGPNDALFALVKAPYAHRTMAALESARAHGATTIVITDSRTAPPLQFADHGFVVSTDSPQFFSSYAATLVLMETMISMLLAQAGPEAEQMIRDAELQIDRLGENWAQ